MLPSSYPANISEKTLLTSVLLFVCGYWLFDDFGRSLGDALGDSCASRAYLKKPGSIYVKSNMREIMSILGIECPPLSTQGCTRSIGISGDCSQM
ncbi:hypothetical protein E5S67_05442 [Microcoleus sp. IPMA8]|uniref:Transposase n=1 Tax=Microcoleus asticus IPMA8 TaxID=2563858 RepID=A0ABX2D6T0_9CYAN|nr:hypothetical protein [Microcoleus asticus IPMA8]